MDDELALATAQGNTFQGTRGLAGASTNAGGLLLPTPKQSLQNQTNMLQSDQGAILNRFKDSIEANPTQVKPPATQAEQVTNAITSYQQQMKDMKENIDKMGQTVGLSV